MKERLLPLTGPLASLPPKRRRKHSIYHPIHRRKKQDSFNVHHPVNSLLLRKNTALRLGRLFRDYTPREQLMVWLLLNDSVCDRGVSRELGCQISEPASGVYAEELAYCSTMVRSKLDLKLRQGQGLSSLQQAPELNVSGRGSIHHVIPQSQRARRV